MQKLARIWEDIRFRGQTRISFECAVWLMRTASYAILPGMSHLRRTSARFSLIFAGKNGDRAR